MAPLDLFECMQVTDRVSPDKMLFFFFLVWFLELYPFPFSGRFPKKPTPYFQTSDETLWFVSECDCA